MSVFDGHLNWRWERSGYGLTSRPRKCVTLPFLVFTWTSGVSFGLSGGALWLQSCTVFFSAPTHTRTHVNHARTSRNKQSQTHLHTRTRTQLHTTHTHSRASAHTHSFKGAHLNTEMCVRTSRPIETIVNARPATIALMHHQTFHCDV